MEPNKFAVSPTDVDVLLAFSAHSDDEFLCVPVLVSYRFSKLSRGAS